MRVIEESQQAISLALKVLEEGGVVAHATETCYGLACDLTNPKAVEKLFAIKERPPQFPVIALFPSIEASEEWLEWSVEARALAEKYFTGPLTIVLPMKKKIPVPIFPSPTPTRGRGEKQGGTTLAFRVSTHPVAFEISKRFAKPLSTTSANLAKLSETYNIAEMEKQFAQGTVMPDIAIDSGPLEKRLPSTIVSFEDGTMRILRQGSLHLTPKP